MKKVSKSGIFVHLLNESEVIMKKYSLYYDKKKADSCEPTLKKPYYLYSYLITAMR